MSPPISLSRAFMLQPFSRLAITGAGGKTTTLFTLARSCFEKVLVSHSAHLSVEQQKLADRVVLVMKAEDVPDVAESLSNGITLFSGPLDERGRAHGLELDALEKLKRLADVCGVPLLIEADGSRRLPMKAPAEWEPPVPDFCNQVIVTVGMKGIGQPLEEGQVFRAAEFAHLSGGKIGAPVTVQILAEYLKHPQGGLKNIPWRARRTLLLNQADSLEQQSQCEALAGWLLHDYDDVICASMNEPVVHSVSRRVGGVVLAAGAASRMGSPKQLLVWQGETLVCRSIRAALEGGLSPVIVVVGAHAEQVCQAVSGLPVQVVVNDLWRDGQSSSVKVGLKALPEGCGAAVFLLADQPWINADLVTALRKRYNQTLAEVIAPQVNGKRANPVLFDRITFGEFDKLSGDTGGRQVLTRHVVEYLPWPDERILLDVDTPEDWGRIG